MGILEEIKMICAMQVNCEACPMRFYNPKYDRAICFAKTLPAEWDIKRIKKELSSLKTVSKRF